MAVQLESAARLAALRDKADAVTGERSATLAGAVDALIAGFGAGGGSSGGSLESGELTTTSANFWGFTIPVTSKKSHVVVYPKVFEDGTHNTGRVSYLLVVEGWGQIEIRPGGAVYMRPSSDMSTTFNDNSIVVGDGKAPYNTGEYYWFAW
jgi:hypothetical protein